MTGTLRLPHHVASAALARRRVGQELRSRHLGRGLVDDVALVLSELVSNSVRHGGPLPGGELEVSWQVRTDEVELRVTDGGGGEVPRSQVVGPEEVRGRGLSIVAGVAATWGVETSAVGTTVWAVLALGGRSLGGTRQLWLGVITLRW